MYRRPLPQPPVGAQRHALVCLPHLSFTFGSLAYLRGRYRVKSAADTTLVFEVRRALFQRSSSASLSSARLGAYLVSVPLISHAAVQARFESGNLKSAIRVAEYEYDCTLRNDMFTDGHTQWFFFSV